MGNLKSSLMKRQESGFDILTSMIRDAGERAAKKREADDKFKRDLLQKALEHKFKQMDEDRKLKQSQPQSFTPAQQYLARRYKEQNPLTALDIPQVGAFSPQGNEFPAYPSGGGQPRHISQGIAMPASEVIYNDKKKTYSVQPLSRERQAELMIAKVDQMIAEGKQPHPAILNIVDRMRDYMEAKKNSPKTAEVASWQKQLKYLTDRNYQIPEEGTEEYEEWKSEVEALENKINSAISPGSYNEINHKRGYGDEIENAIEATMKRYGKSRDEVIAAMKKKGMI